MRILLMFIFIGVSTAFAQPSQSVRGKVVDTDTQFPLAGVRVEIFTSDSTQKYRAITGPEGDFAIENVPVGKHELIAKYMTYDTKVITVVVNSGKQTVITLAMQESFVEVAEVNVSARKKGDVINELALISAQQFSVEETDRYPGSRSDPARMASNFAGVGGADDSRNDIVIRGNSPLGVVWRVEGIDIPNPSHFAISGSTGGPVSILNNKILANSDFFMSAFPAEYGNSTSGIFDLKLRNGNDTKHELTGQFGFLGTELMAEGPMGRNGNSSYLVMGRYSTLSLFQAIGIKIGTDAVPTYGDGAFKFNWKLKNGGALSLWAIGGASDIDIIIADPVEVGGDAEEIYGEGDRDQYFGSIMAVGGLTLKKPINKKTFLTSTIAYAYEEQHSHHDYLIRQYDSVNSLIVTDSKYPLLNYKFSTSKIQSALSVKYKFNKKHLIKVGFNADYYMFDMIDSVLATGHNATNHDTWDVRWDNKSGALLAQVYLQWKWRITENMAFTAGIHNQYFSMSNSFSIAEPRIGWKLNLNKGQSISIGAGMHSQMQPTYTYLYHQYDTISGEKIYHNQNMDFSRSVHAGIGYEIAFKKNLTLKSEAYYQYIYNVPVTVAPSSFSLINMGSGFSRFFPEPLENTGTGYNYGIELTLQKYFNKSFFFLLSGTVYDSKYIGSDGILRNTSYNGNYIANLLAGKEFKLGPKHSISVGVKVTVAGGKRYGYVDEDASAAVNELIYKDSLFNERQFYDYFRADLKINWKINGKRTTHEIGLDLVNIFNSKNLLGLAYSPNIVDPSQESFATRNQLGFLPIFYYKIDLRLERKNRTGN
ncbi:MAG: carboxypeptidase regulatory-like domain-containing protein [Crocinitomicaceae bacterium]|nr:carboxypeptidase regulatory-like domain-containing protein [Crocinitomicaceae bacterium]